MGEDRISVVHGVNRAYGPGETVVGELSDLRQLRFSEFGVRCDDGEGRVAAGARRLRRNSETVSITDSIEAAAYRVELARVGVDEIAEGVENHERADHDTLR